MNIPLFIIILLAPFFSRSQNTKTFYEDGIKRGDSIFDASDNLTVLKYYHKNGKLQLEAFYDTSGAVNDYYALDEKGDTAFQSQIPLLKRQPKKDLNHIQWRETDFFGLFYAVEHASSGEVYQDGDNVKLHYIGYFIDGSQFDNSYLTGKALALEIGGDGFLPSFYEGLKKFRIGEKGYLKIPSELGYGAIPYANIPPNSTLIYYLDLTVK